MKAGFLNARARGVVVGGSFPRAHRRRDQRLRLEELGLAFSVGGTFHDAARRGAIRSINPDSGSGSDTHSRPGIRWGGSRRAGRQSANRASWHVSLQLTSDFPWAGGWPWHPGKISRPRMPDSAYWGPFNGKKASPTTLKSLASYRHARRTGLFCHLDCLRFVLSGSRD